MQTGSQSPECSTSTTAMEFSDQSTSTHNNAALPNRTTTRTIRRSEPSWRLWGNGDTISREPITRSCYSATTRISSISKHQTCSPGGKRDGLRSFHHNTSLFNPWNERTTLETDHPDDLIIKMAQNDLLHDSGQPWRSPPLNHSVISY